MKLVKLNTLFDVKYGNKFDANKMKFVKDSDINFISRSAESNGCAGCVEKYEGIEPYEKGLITVSLGGSILSSFVQPKKFYTAQNIVVLTSLKEMTLNEKLFYCKCISINRFKYSAFGREANKTIHLLDVPQQVPNWVNETKTKDYSKLVESLADKKTELNIKKWKPIRLDSIFTVTGSKTTSKKTLKVKGRGKYPYLTTQTSNNGVEGFYNFYTDEGNILVIDSAVRGFCSYQSENFTASDHVEKLIPKFNMNIFIGLFLSRIINLENFRYSYGRKFNQDRIKNTSILLPVDNNNKPDWSFMENYIKGIKYSKMLSKFIQ